MSNPIISDDAVVLGMLVVVVGLVFYTRSLGGRWTTFYTFVPALLLCYLIPSLMNSFGLISSEGSNLWTVAKDYFLPACLVLMTLSIDLKAIIGLGPKALFMFFTAVVGIVLGGPVAVFLVSLFSPETVGGEGMNAAWRGFATLAGGWIGGGANQTAMLEVYGYNPEPPGSLVDFMLIAAVAMGTVGASHLFAGLVTPVLASVDALQGTVLTNKFFWVVVVATTVGLGMSFTRARELEGAGASKIGSVFIMVLRRCRQQGQRGRGSIGARGCGGLSSRARAG
jgi:hypothetical protein